MMSMPGQIGGPRQDDSKRESYHSSEPESKTSNTSGPSSANKKRPSRAGTRSVNTLSQAQLERKRANDREAQRAIRQRTKEHIESLERRVAELSSSPAGEQHSNAIKRIRELEEENQMLRAKLDQANYAGFGESSPVSANWDEASHVRGQPRPEPTSFPPMSQWGTGGPPPFSPTSSLRTGEMPSQHDPGVWRGDRARSSTAGGGGEQLAGQMSPGIGSSQDMNQYTYTLGSQAASHPRNPSQSSIYQHGQDQQIRQISEQLGIPTGSAAAVAQYGPIAPHQQPQPQQQQRYSQPGGPPGQQSPHAQTNFTPQNPHSGQGIFYGSYPRQ